MAFFSKKSREHSPKAHHPTRRVTSIAAAASLATVGWVGLSAAPAMAAPFDPETPTVWVSQGLRDEPTHVFQGIQTEGEVHFEQVGSQPSPATFNALGFNSADGYLWAVGGGPEGFGLKRIGDDGVVTHHDVDLPQLSKEIDVGAFGEGEFADRLLVTLSGSMETMYIIDVATGAVQTQALTDGATVGDLNPSANDWTAYAGYLWGGQRNGGHVVRVDPATGIIDMFPVADLTVDGPLGAAWTYGNDNLALSSNKSGEITQVHVENPTSDAPEISVVSVVPGPATRRNDGANSIGAPTDLGVVKTAPATVDPAGTIEWDVTVSNQGTTGSSGFTLTDAMPDGVTDVRATGPNAALCTVTGLAVSCIGDPLVAGAAVTYSFTGTASEVEATLLNTATVNANEEDLNPANDTDTAMTVVVVEQPVDPPSGTDDPAPVPDDPAPGTDDPAPGTDEPAPGTDDPPVAGEDPAVDPETEEILAVTGFGGTELLLGSAGFLLVAGAVLLALRRRHRSMGA